MNGKVFTPDPQCLKKGMSPAQREFFSIIDGMRKLNFSRMLPDISHGDFCVLSRVNGGCCGEGNALRVSDIVKKMQIPAPAVSRSLRNLERHDWIVRTVDVKDRRNTYVQITEAGRTLVAQVEGTMDDFSRAVFGQFGEDRLMEMNGYLRRFLETAREEIDRRRGEMETR